MVKDDTSPNFFECIHEKVRNPDGDIRTNSHRYGHLCEHVLNICAGEGRVKPVV